MLGRSAVRLLMHRPKQAKADARDAAERLPDDVRPWVAMGLAHLATRDFKLAKQSFKRAIELDGNYPGGRWAQGRCGVGLRSFLALVQLQLNDAAAGGCSGVLTPAPPNPTLQTFTR